MRAISKAARGLVPDASTHREDQSTSKTIPIISWVHPTSTLAI